MLSLNQAIEIKESILAYLKATFSFQDKEVHKAFYDFINDPKEGLFKGPYLSLKLPFVKANDDELKGIPLDIKPNWLPYDHQVKSWHRLSTAKEKPKPTIITTGTGSGKTESFLFPILDYCYRNLNRDGIKVIILYPMNALATDQARRLAEAIYEDPRLKDKVTAGLFIGEGKSESKYHQKERYPKTMGQHHVIENRESILSSPPDILLTNFKMLDYGLMKANYNDLWLGNYKDNTVLQFLVLDELHTYDGAQGTDVANLIRRLKLKLDIPEDHLCPVGTSATIGSGEEAPRLLSEYATKIFGEKIEPDSIITENRVSISDFFGNDELELFTPRPSILKDIKPITGEGYEKYLERQMGFWQMDRSSLSDSLLKLQIVKDLSIIINKGAGIHTLNTIIRDLSNLNGNFKTLPQWDVTHEFNPKEAVILSLFALISEAKVSDPKSGRKSPFLYTQTQIWVRELSGVLRVMSEKPSFAWKESIDQSESNLGLPPWYCRDCGASGWLGIKHDNKERFEKEVKDVYTKFFAKHKHIYFINRSSWFNQADAVSVGYEADDVLHKHIYNRTLGLHDRTAENRTEVTAFRKLDNNGYNDHVCPECNTRNTVSIIGTRTATLSSIAVSQTLSTDLDLQNEQQRKVLAFTNAVQDAAHQAGFVEARNYRFTFRSSLQKVINLFDDAISLKELSDEFSSFWKKNSDETGKQPVDAYFYRFYPSDYIGKSSPRDYLNGKSYESEFQKEFDSRMSWEVISEFGYNALIGRTLEKTKSSATRFDLDDLTRVWDSSRVWLAENEPSNTITKELFLPFLELLLHRVRTRGAISHTYLEKFRGRELKLWDLNWMKDSRHFLHRKYGPKTRIPRLITDIKESRGLLDSTYARTTNWFHQYFKKSFPLASQHIDIVNEFYGVLIKELEAHQILDVKNNEEHVNYALNPEKIYVNNQVETYECDTCGHNVFTTGTNDRLSSGSCLNYRCTGHYELKNDSNYQNYYQLVYNRQRSPRIYAADHTGLLERRTRELLETDFKNRPKFNSKNVMVATSTLEMGIDIGTLNTAINNSIPPLPSNFLQRIGRAGRATGSALVVNFAKSQAHDLFYFTDPLDMMAGEIATPGCYLEAKEILKRHFFAFSIDTWTKNDPVNNGIPAMIRFISIETADLKDPNFFMNGILNFIKVNEDELFKLFKSAYKDNVSDHVFEELRYELTNDSFYQFHKKIFERLKQEIYLIRESQKEIDERIKSLNLSKNDPERIELENQKKNLGGIINSIKKRNVLEHLTNVGALPNYAFPETGVSLMAKVIGNKAIASTKPPINKDFELVRSASQAIKEFAPDNHFYSQGYKFLITGINTFDWSDPDNFHEKRFCSNCDHTELNSVAKKGGCPKCGHESWLASANVHKFARLKSVKSFNNQSDATLNDSSEERDNLLYNRIQHFNFSESKSLGAIAMKEIPFGIEFVKNITITEDNLGRRDAINASRIRINDIEVPRHGFVTCKHCGKSSSNFQQRDYKFHYGYCKHKNEDYKGMSDVVFEEVFFFRDLQTEALKILLPVQELNSESEIKMFKAGIELGLKKYFNGNPQHLRIVNYKEYNHTTNKFDRYLVMYDSIPGGTGYLEKLFDSKAFSKLLNNAYQEIKACTCQHNGKDGCYRCIYSYTNQYDQEELSRAQAEKRFEDIVKRTEDWESHPSGLGNLTNKGNIEESELEVRFIRSLKKLSEINDNWAIEEVNDDGIITYVLSYATEKKKLTYHIRPQINLGQSDGIEFHTRTDFLMICTECEVNGVKEDVYSIPRLAIYLDGYQYHASKEYNRFHNDYDKRRAITNSNSHYSWTLTWDDLDIFDNGLGVINDDNDYLSKRIKETEFALTKKNLSAAFIRNTDSIDQFKNNFSRFLEILKGANSIESIKRDLTLYLSFFQKKIFNPSYDPEEIDKAMSGSSLDNFCAVNKSLDGLIVSDLIEDIELFDLRVVVNIQKAQAFYKLNLNEPEDINKSIWNIFWQIYNLLQFSEEYLTPKESTAATNVHYTSEDLLELFDVEYHAILKQLVDSGHLKNEQDELELNSLLDDKGNIIAEAELILHYKKVAVEPYGQEDKKLLARNGFKIITKEEIKELVL